MHERGLSCCGQLRPTFNRPHSASYVVPSAAVGAVSSKLRVFVSVTWNVDVWWRVIVVLVSEPRLKVLVVGIVTSTVTTCSIEVLASFPRRTLSIEDVVATAVVVKVDSKDMVVVKVIEPTLISAGFSYC